MTLAELRTELTQLLAYDLDNKAGDIPAASQLNAQINDALRTVSRAAFLVRQNIALTLPGNEWRFNLHTLTPTPVTVLRIYNAGVPFLDYLGRPGVLTQPELAADYPMAESGLITGIPDKAAQSDQYLTFNRKPATNVPLILTAQVEATPLTADGQEPDLPEWMHQAIAYQAAFEAAIPQVETEAGTARIQSYLQLAMSRIQDEAARNRTLWGMGSETKRDEEQKP